MKKWLDEPATYVILYFVVMIVTFGNAYHNIPDEEVGHWAGHEYTIHNGPGTKVFGAMVSSVAWPLYWSVRLQK